MPIFTYKASDLDRVLQSGTITADTPRQARDLLRERGLSIHAVSESTSRPTRTTFARPRGRSSRLRTTTFISELATLLAVGVPLLEALATIADQHRGGFKTSVLLLRDRVAAGSSLADAMRQQPRT